MRQTSFVDCSFKKLDKRTRKEQFPAKNGLSESGGTNVDATLIDAPAKPTTLPHF